MNNNLTIQKIILNYLLEYSTLSEIIKTPINTFEDSDIKNIYSIIHKFAEKFQSKPSKEQIKTLCNEEGIQIGLVDVLLDVNLQNYDEEWLNSTVQGTVKWKKFYDKIINLITYIKSLGTVDPLSVDSHIEKCSNMMNTSDMQIFDSIDIGKDFFDIETHFRTSEDMIPTNHIWINNILGGYPVGTLQVFCAFANVGKSIFLCNEAADYIRKGYDVAYISAEMSETSINQRIGANLIDIPIDYYRDPSKKDFIRNKFQQFKDYTLLPFGHLYVKQFPTSTATVTDIENYYLNLVERGISPKILVVDYLGILAPKNKAIADNLYLKIKSIAEDLRALAIKYKIIIITASQLNRSGDEVSDITLSSIAESSGLVHTADTMYGIIQNSEMKLSNEYWVKILRIREGGGKNRRCRYTIDYSRMRLTETNEIYETEI